MKKFLILSVVLLALTSVAGNFAEAYRSFMTPKAVVNPPEQVRRGYYMYMADFECKELPGRDKYVDYWVVITDGKGQREVSISPCFADNRGGNYVFTYEGGLRLYRYILSPLFVNDKSVEIQYFMKITSKDTKPEIYASPVYVLLTPKK
jgi:hypothetical protein